MRGMKIRVIIGVILLFFSCDPSRKLGDNTYECGCLCTTCYNEDLCETLPPADNPIVVCADTREEAEEACIENKCYQEAWGIECSLPSPYIVPCYPKKFGPDWCIVQYVSIESEESCELSSVRPLAGFMLESNILIISPELSSAVVEYNGDVGTTTGTGRLAWTGGCFDTGGECEIEFEYFVLEGEDFEIDGRQVEDILIMNNGPLKGKIDSEGNFNIPPDNVEFYIRGKVDGVYNSFVMYPENHIVGRIDNNNGTFYLETSLTDSEGSIHLYIAGTMENRVPIARLETDEEVECEGELTYVNLDGSNSYDPDGTDDITNFLWYNDPWGDERSYLGEGDSLELGLSVGEHIIGVYVFDTHNSYSLAMKKITVLDTTPPEILNIEVEPQCLWPPNHKYVKFTLGENIRIEAEDRCYGKDINYKILYVESNEPDNGIGDGDTVNDAVWNDTSFCLRSERSGNGSGRIYTVYIEVSDPEGNATVTSINITVPHDRRDREDCQNVSSFIEDGDPECLLENTISDNTYPIQSQSYISSSGCTINMDKVNTISSTLLNLLLDNLIDLF